MSKGENIFKRKDGRWEARYIRGYELSGKIKYGFCYGKTYKEAKEKVTKFKAASQTFVSGAAQCGIFQPKSAAFDRGANSTKGRAAFWQIGQPAAEGSLPVWGLDK